MPTPSSEDAERFIDGLAATVYTPEGIARAEEYARSRNLEPGLFSFPWAVGPSDARAFEWARPITPPITLVDSLFIPILDMGWTPEQGTPRLAGFDIRYIGPIEGKLRWHKFKRTPQTPLFYNHLGLLRSDSIILTEAAMDAETFRACGFDACASLTAADNPRFLQFLIASCRKVFLAYDNDDGGQKARDKIIAHVQGVPELAGFVQPLIYPGKDPNKAVELLGREGFRSRILHQLQNSA